MGQCESRATTMVSIELRQLERFSSEEKVSVIQFVDCMSRHRAERFRSIDMLKEVRTLTTSIKTLGVVISAVADRSSGKGRNAHVPYRDSALTRLMQQSLGGSCVTSMLVTLSPSYGEFDESLSCLRYGDQTRKIKNHVKLNSINLEVLRA